MRATNPGKSGKGLAGRKQKNRANARLFIIPGRLHVTLRTRPGLLGSIVFVDRLHAQPDTALLVDLEHLDLDHVAFLDHVGHVLDTLV